MEEYTSIQQTIAGVEELHPDHLSLCNRMWEPGFDQPRALQVSLATERRF